MLIPCSSQKNTDGDTELIFGFYVWFDIRGFVLSVQFCTMYIIAQRQGGFFYLWKLKIEL